MESLITIIIPVYNTSNYIDACINSIINQDYRNIEIILVNDGSTDNSFEKCENWAEKDSRIKYITQDNRGPSAARNEGVRCAHGEYILFVDSDDTVEPDYVSVMYKAILEKDADIVVAFMDRLAYKKFSLPENIPELVTGNEAVDLLCDGIITENAVCKLYKSELLINTPFKEGMIYEDNLFTFEIIGKCKKVAICNQFLYHYTMRGDSITQTLSIENFKAKINAMTLASDYIENYYSASHKKNIERRIGDWFYIEYLYHKYYAKSLTRQECVAIKEGQKKLRKNIINNAQKANSSEFSKKARIKLFIARYVPGLGYPLENMYKWLRN